MNSADRPRRLSAALRSTLVVSAIILIGGITAILFLTWHSAIAPVDRPAPATFQKAIVSRGATLAAIGNCTSCHSLPSRPAFSGGLPVQTPFGEIYASNITPDPDDGIGRWSEAAFRRAMRDGIDRAGHNLYPAFPYNHYTRVSDADDAALYAYLMTRAPAKNVVSSPALPFPLNVRAVMAGWNLLFFRAGAYQPDPHREADWNHGAYLVEGLGHCGACHTPHNALGAEKHGHDLAGGMAEGWNAYALNASSPAPVAWTVDALAFYLRHGWQAEHGVARGPMALVTASLRDVPESDLHDMAVYLVSLMGRPGGTKEPAQPIAPLPPQSAGSQVAVSDSVGGRGALVYSGACASCHDSGRPLPYGGLSLSMSSALHAPDPSNIIIVTLQGLEGPSEEPGPIMPGFAGSLDDADIVALLRFLRANVAHEAPWPDLETTVRRARRTASSVAGHGTVSVRADTQARSIP